MSIDYFQVWCNHTGQRVLSKGYPRDFLNWLGAMHIQWLNDPEIPRPSFDDWLVARLQKGA